jgi:hypothetical protein
MRVFAYLRFSQVISRIASAISRASYSVRLYAIHLPP